MVYYFINIYLKILEASIRQGYISSIKFFLQSVPLMRWIVDIKLSFVSQPVGGGLTNGVK